MDGLKGKTILVGKEPGQGRLLVAISGTVKTAVIGTPGCVPKCVSRCRPTENVAHAKITIDQSGSMILSNMKEENVTFVNGSEIASKRINASSIVEFGKDRFPISISAILETAKKIIGEVATQPIYNISHLESVWNEMHSKRKGILAKQKKINMVRSGCGIFTMCAMPCIFLFGPIGYTLTGIGIIGNVYSFVGLKNDDSSDAIEQLNEDFQLRYVCPNPTCNKFFGTISYKLLKNQLRSHKDQKMYCPRCGCELVEN